MENNNDSLIVPDQSSLVREDISCPKCGSKNIHIGKKGYRGGRALIGTLLLGPVGLLIGQINANKVLKTCLGCNNIF